MPGLSAVDGEFDAEDRSAADVGSGSGNRDGLAEIENGVVGR
jgi:hypothetical protein